MKRVWRMIRILAVFCALGMVMTAKDLQAHRTQGPLGEFRARYAETPVVEQTVQSGNYHIYFCAFDMGHEVHMIAYARFGAREEKLYQQLIRVSVQDAYGNAFTIYRDHASEVLDEPIRWAYRQPGRHTVTVEIRPYPTNEVDAHATYTMMLERKSPTPVVLTSAIGILLAAMAAVLVLKRRRRNNHAPEKHATGG